MSVHEVGKAAVEADHQRPRESELAHELEREPFGSQRGFGRRRIAEVEGFKVRRRITIDDVVLTEWGNRCLARGSDIRDILVGVGMWFGR